MIDLMPSRERTSVLLNFREEAITTEVGFRSCFPLAMEQVAEEYEFHTRGQIILGAAPALKGPTTRENLASTEQLYTKSQ